ncbi:YqaJ viral recombinase family protein, partial [Escherichia coli]
AAYFGNVLEEVVAKEFAKRTDLKVQRSKAILQHPEYPWMLANVDRLIVGEKIGLECKTASEYLKKEWEDEELHFYVELLNLYVLQILLQLLL